MRDDLGNSPGLRYEIIFFRKLDNGEYIVNIHYYGNRESGPNKPVNADIHVFSNSDQKASKKIFSKSISLSNVGEEITIIRFKVENKNIDTSSFTFRPFNMVYKSGVYQ